MTVLQIDFETRSALDLRKTGVYPYARHPSTDVWCMAWAFDDEEPGLYVPQEGRAEGGVLRFLEHVEAGGEVRAFNAQFERVIWNEILVPRYGFPPLTIEQTHCTAAEAAAMALPRGLGQAAQVLGLPTQKDDDGRRLILQMSKPRRPRKGEPEDALLWWDDTERLEKLYDYCRQDVRTERAVAKVIRRLSPAERAVYCLDQRVNDRGVRVDLDLVRAARRVVDRGIAIGNTELHEITSGAVDAVTKIADLKRWFRENGLEVDSLSKDIVRDLLADEESQLDPVVQRALVIRRETGKSSTSKLEAFIHATCDDSRARGLYLYHGASPGRWTGKLIQSQNFPRPVIKDIERYIPGVLGGEYTLIDMEQPPVMVVSDMLRSMFTASPGSILRAGDYAQIEARILAWIAEQEDLLQLFADGGRVYEAMAAAIYGVPVESIDKDSPERRIGKNAILGAGYQMGADRFAEQVQEQTGIVLPRGERDEDGKLLPGEEDLAARAIGAYRRKNARIKQFWGDINAAAIEAVMEPGEVVSVGRRESIKYIRKGQYLWCRLPGGRFLCYALPEMRKVLAPWGREKKERGEPVTATDFVVSLTYVGVDSMTKQWRRQPTYGGHLTENVVQAMARDLLAGAMLRLEMTGYPVVMHTHDEVVCDVPEGVGSQEEFLATMATRPQWAHDIPVKVEGWEGERYRK